MEADYLILADSAQVQADKLFMLGGGWGLVWSTEFPAQHPMAIAAAILVGWDETNIRHQMHMEVRSEDTSQVLWTADGTFEQGRLPGIPSGSTQRVQIALSLLLALPSAGDYVAELLVDGQHLKKVPFRAIQAASVAPLPGR